MKSSCSARCVVLRIFSVGFPAAGRPRVLGHAVCTAVAWLAALAVTGSLGAQSANGGHGLQGAYFANRNLSGSPAFTRVDPTIDFDWGYGSPGANVPGDDFSIRWTGQIQPRFTEAYVFKGNRDNGFRLWIDGQLIVDLWNNEWGVYESRPIALQADRRYEIKIEYYEDYGGANVALKWRSPSQAEEVVPAACLFPAATPTGATNGRRPQLDRSQWFATRGSWNDHFGEGKPFDASGIAVADGELTLNADQTDQVGVLYSRPVPVPPGSTVIIRRRIFVHTANREFEGALMAYGVADPGLSAAKPPMDQSLFYIGYRNYDYQTDQNLFTLADGRVYPPGPGKFAGGTAPTTAPLWDQWFNEEVRYNAGTGDTVYSINGQERMRLKARPLDQPYLKLLLHPYGWYTGHYLRMRDFQIAVETRTPAPPTGEGTGLLGAYFANPDCAGTPKFTRVDWTIRFIWGHDSPGDGVPAENFSVRWTGQIRPRYSEAYVICGYRDDGVRVWIDGRLIIDQWGPGNYTPFASAPILLTANQRYDIRIEYQQLAGQARLALAWKSPSQPEETIPGACLFPAPAPATPVSTEGRNNEADVTPPPGSGAATDLRTRLLQTTYTWSDGDNSLGTVSFAADGVARPSWSRMPHVWRLDPGGALVISAGGTTFVTRLTYNPDDGSFNGVRDRTSQVQDGVRSMMRPVVNR